jgi:hypothetical protein
VERVRQLVRERIVEVWITGQDTGAYGLDIGCDLATLLEEVSDIEGEFLIRVGMMNPNQALRIMGRLIEAYKNGKIYKLTGLFAPVNIILGMIKYKKVIDVNNPVVFLFSTGLFFSSTISLNMA